ncbi:MAG: hypothetical protein ACOZDY_08180 [Pseudomonadota bacterium]
MSEFTESAVEDAALAWLEAPGYAVVHGPDIAAGEPGAEYRKSGRDVALAGRTVPMPTRHAAAIARHKGPG